MPFTLTALTIQTEQQQDEELQDLIQKSSLQLQRIAIEHDTKIYCDISTGFVRPYIPASLRRTAFNTVHGLSHPSARNTSRLLKEKYVWPGIKRDALKWTRECTACQRAKIHRHNRLYPQNIEVPDSRFNHINIDLVHMPESDGYKYCLTIIDRFSRWPVAVPLKNITAETVATALFSQWIAHYGTPITITSYQGAQFESGLFKALAQFIGSNKTRTLPYHPASNGIIERWHRSFKAALMCQPHIPWTNLLPSLMLGLRTTYKEDLKSSPAETLYGTTVRVPGEFFVHQDLPANPQNFIERHRTIMRSIRPTPTSHHVKTRLFRIKNLDTCTHVFIRCDHVKAPLEPPYMGPYQIVERVSDRLFKINVDGHEKKPLC